jgi:thioredoxin-related protein
MKKAVLTLITGLLALHLSAAEGEWLTNFAKAQEKAKAEKKILLMDFTGSDWCPPCKALHRNVFSKKEFLDYAKDNLVLMEIDFPKAKPQNEELKRANAKLAEKFGVEAYPTIVVLDSDGKQLSKEAGYGGTSAADYVAKLKKLKKT